MICRSKIQFDRPGLEDTKASSVQWPCKNFFGQYFNFYCWKDFLISSYNRIQQKKSNSEPDTEKIIFLEIVKKFWSTCVACSWNWSCTIFSLLLSKHKPRVFRPVLEMAMVKVYLTKHSTNPTSSIYGIHCKFHLKGSMHQQSYFDELAEKGLWNYLYIRL